VTDALSVLVVDDDFRVAAMHAEVVATRPGFRALAPARTVAEARRTLMTEVPDLLLVDLYLPDGDGIDLLSTAGVDGFVLTAATDAPSVRRAVRAGALGVLLKPFEPRVLADRLDRYARARNLLAGTGALDQADIDRALAIVHGTGDAASVSRAATEQLVLDALGDDEASAAELGERAGISRATAQRHLSALAARGRVEVTLRYGMTGRPEHRYRAR